MVEQSQVTAREQICSVDEQLRKEKEFQLVVFNELVQAEGANIFLFFVSLILIWSNSVGEVQEAEKEILEHRIQIARSNSKLAEDQLRARESGRLAILASK